ncbi:MAG: hypothetical protein H7301_10015 [Cryobacterium sp.]|nr:hypothetical protein [Oligoflexia bacterium]
MSREKTRLKMKLKPRDANPENREEASTTARGGQFLPRGKKTFGPAGKISRPIPRDEDEMADEETGVTRRNARGRESDDLDPSDESFQRRMETRDEKNARFTGGPVLPEVDFPASWTWFFDECLPAWVKDHYSPKESWKGKPFTSEDGKFFLKGIRDLSDLFTDDRPKQLPDYLAHGKYRSSYMLYFLPLQGAKFIALFNQHSKAVDAAVAHGLETGTMRIMDLGAGPATASIALLLNLLARKGELPPKIEFVLFDQNSAILKDGESLLRKIGESFPKMRGRVTVRLQVGDLWQTVLREKNDVSLALFGHTLNEYLPMRDGRPDPKPFSHIFSLLKFGGGILWAEPAAKMPSQMLSQLRDYLFEEGLIEETPHRIWGPCLHSGRCPMAVGRDWCHFSIAGKIPGKWFGFFSKGLSKEKEWLKYSYLWITSERDLNSSPIAPNLRLVLTDPLSRDPRAKKEVLLCEPEIPLRYTFSPTEFLRRGMKILLKNR